MPYLRTSILVRGVAQPVSVSRLSREGRRFESYIYYIGRIVIGKLKVLEKKH
jgi:hypothetical protein